jgi:hypothetical protein
VLPDLVQDVPDGLRLAGADDSWRLAFSSTIRNAGAGPFRIEGHGGGAADVPMTADQVVARDDNTTQTYPAIGELRYVNGFGHQHWHLMRLESYELISRADPGNVVSDRKTGFCMVAGYANDYCARGTPTATSLVEGLLPGQSDTYTQFVEYQELGISRQTTPSGEYDLVHTANPDGLFHEASTANNSASLLLDIQWPASGSPAITCPDLANDECPAAFPPVGSGGFGAPGGPATPAPPADSPPSDPPAGQDPKPEPELVPVIQDPVTVTGASAKMTRAQATDLARRAVRLATKGRARVIASSCGRRATDAFGCRIAWTQTHRRWRGKLGLRYRMVMGRLRWSFDLDAADSRSGRRLRRSSAAESSNLATLRAGAASMLCAPAA